MATPSFGTVSHGTLKPSDLLLSFSHVLENLAKTDSDVERKNASIQLLADLKAVRDRCGSLENLGNTDEAHEFLDDFFDLLNEYAPPYAYFGALEGDGSDFGFWPAMTALEEAAAAEDGVLKLEAGEPWPSKETLDDCEVNYIMEVSDHGNVTLYSSSTRREIWSVV